MFYRINYIENAVSNLEKLNGNVRKRILKAIEERLSQSPEFYGKPLRFSLKGLWSLRVGDYRVVYQIKEDEIVIVKVGHRKDVYGE